MNGNKYMKRYSTPLVIREMQFKITMRYYFIITNLTKLRWLLISNVAKDMDRMPVSPGASGMQPRDPCRPWRGTLASGHKPR